MERISAVLAKQIFGQNFLGIEEIESIADKLGLYYNKEIMKRFADIPYSQEELLQKKDTHVLFFVQNKSNQKDLKISINYLKSILGSDPSESEPCFYNQDWYIKEQFANQCNVDSGWYLLRKSLIETSRGESPDKSNLARYPSALLVTYAYFVFKILHGISLYDNDYVWCSDTDEAGDQVYVGRYTDPEKIAKNGFSIHRHLSIKKNYGTIV